MSEAERRRLEALYEEHAKAIFAYALRRTGSLADAEEVVSETFLVAWRKVGSIPEGEPILWLYSVARKVVANKERSKRRQGLLARRAGKQQGLAAVTKIESTEAEVDLAAAIGKLKTSHQEALVLAYWCDLEPSAAAKVLGRSQVGFNSLLHRARKALAEALAEAGGVEGR